MLTIYRCVADGVAHYVSKPMAGVDCEIATTARLLSDRWEFVVRSADNSIVSFDKTSMDRTGDQVTVWVQYHNAQGDERRTMVRDTFDCKARTATTQAVVGYAHDGTQTRNHSPLQAFPRAVVPDTVHEVVFRRVCSAR